MAGARPPAQTPHGDQAGPADSRTRSPYRSRMDPGRQGSATGHARAGAQEPRATARRGKGGLHWPAFVGAETLSGGDRWRVAAVGPDAGTAPDAAGRSGNL